MGIGESFVWKNNGKLAHLPILATRIFPGCNSVLEMTLHRIVDIATQNLYTVGNLKAFNQLQFPVNLLSPNFFL